MTRSLRRPALISAALAGVLLLAGCSGQSGPAAPASSNTASSGPSATSTPTTATPASGSPAAAEIPEPTTTNTLPPPPKPTRAAPSTAGPLSAKSLPVPSGWQTVARPGGEEEGYLGNGTWVHARDPRYAAFDVITIGCAPVTRDDYVDPTAALEGTYDRGGEPGIGLVLEFARPADAQTYFDGYLAQVAACKGEDAPVQITRLPSPAGLIDQRTYPDGDWTEVGALSGRRVSLVILSDPGHRISRAQAQRVLAQMS